MSSYAKAYETMIEQGEDLGALNKANHIALEAAAILAREILKR